jgi:hypothetical protein
MGAQPALHQTVASAIDRPLVNAGRWSIRVAIWSRYALGLASIGCLPRDVYHAPYPLDLNDCIMRPNAFSHPAAKE